MIVDGRRLDPPEEWMTPGDILALRGLSIQTHHLWCWMKRGSQVRRDPSPISNFQDCKVNVLDGKVVRFTSTRREQVSSDV